MFLLPLPVTPKNLCWLFQRLFFRGTRSQLDFLYLWQNGSPCMEYQSLNPAFPLENCILIPDSLHQLQDCTLGGFLGKSKLSLKMFLTPAVWFLSAVMTWYSSFTAIPNHALLWPASDHLRIKLTFPKFIWKCYKGIYFLIPTFSLLNFDLLGEDVITDFKTYYEIQKYISYWLLQKK